MNPNQCELIFKESHCQYIRLFIGLVWDLNDFPFISPIAHSLTDSLLIRRLSYHCFVHCDKVFRCLRFVVDSEWFEIVWSMIFHLQRSQSSVELTRDRHPLSFSYFLSSRQGEWYKTSRILPHSRFKRRKQREEARGSLWWSKVKEIEQRDENENDVNLFDVFELWSIAT